MVAGERREGLFGAPDLGHSGQEDQQVARGRLQPLANAARDERREGRIGGRLVEIVERDGEEAPGAGDDRGVEKGRQAVAVERRRHRQELQLRTRVELHPADQGERQVGEETAFVNLVEQHRADAVEKWIALQALDEDALRDEENPRVAGEVALEADLPADLAAERPTLLLGDPARRSPGRDPPRFEDEDLPAAGDSRTPRAPAARASSSRPPAAPAARHCRASAARPRGRQAFRRPAKASACVSPTDATR